MGAGEVSTTTTTTTHQEVMRQRWIHIAAFAFIYVILNSTVILLHHEITYAQLFLMLLFGLLLALFLPTRWFNDKHQDVRVQEADSVTTIMLEPVSSSDHEESLESVVVKSNVESNDCQVQSMPIEKDDGNDQLNEDSVLARILSQYTNLKSM